MSELSKAIIINGDLVTDGHEIEATLAACENPIALNGPFEEEKAPADSSGDRDWKVVGEAEAWAIALGAPNPYPYPVTVYAKEGQMESGIVGALVGNEYQAHAVTPAPQPSTHWDDTCAGFVPNTVVWNGVVIGGVGRKMVDGIEVFFRKYDGTLLGDWPINPPRAGRIVNPFRAQLAAQDTKKEAA